jgi:bifunctional non-homologous end joining protein LigD
VGEGVAGEVGFAFVCDEGEDDQAGFGGELGGGAGVGVAQDGGHGVEAALPAGLAGVAEDEGLWRETGGEEHGAGDVEELRPVGDDGDEGVGGEREPGGEPGVGGADGQGDELDTRRQGEADAPGLGGAAERDGGGEDFAGFAVFDRDAAGWIWGNVADFGEEDFAETLVGVDDEEVVGAGGGEPLGDTGADDDFGELELADGLEEAGDVAVEDLLRGGGGVGLGADVDAASLSALGPAFEGEALVAGGDGVGVEGEAAGHFAGAGEAVAGLELAAEDGELDLGGELLVDGDLAAGCEPEPHALSLLFGRGAGQVWKPRPLSLYPVCVAKTAKPDTAEVLTIEGHDVRVSSPDKLYFSAQAQLTKLDLVRYFLAVAPGALAGIEDRPIVLKRFVNGACLASGQPEPFYQKRAPDNLPPFLRTVTLSFPSGRTADEVVVDNTAGLAWVVNLGCIELHPHPVRGRALDHPDQLRVDLDPNPGVSFGDVRLVALEVKQVLEEAGLTGFVKTSGSRGIHINAPIRAEWSFTEVRRAALALARTVERRIPALASSKWWKEERHGVFLDYNQNAKDRTTASAYSVRPLADARVSAPLLWEEVPEVEPADFTVLTMPQRFLAMGDPHAGMQARAGSLEALLEMAARDEAEGLGDAPWPPHFAKAEGEGPRVAPSRASKAFGDQIGEGFGGKRFRKQAVKADGAAAAGEKPARKVAAKRTPKHPLITIAQSPDKAAALAGLERWKQANAAAAALLAEDDVLTDRMRGAAMVWYRVRVNLRNVPEGERPAQGVVDPDEDPTRGWREG